MEEGIKRLTNQAAARCKFFQEVRQDGQSYDSWVQLVVEQAKRCDWVGYDGDKAARDAILYQMDDRKLKKKIIAEDTSLQEVIKMGIANEQAGKAADRLHERQQVPREKDRIAELEEQIRALSNKKDKEKVEFDCKTCTRPTHEVGKCKGRKVKCYACGKTGHFKGSAACKAPKVKVKSVAGEDKDTGSDTDSDTIGRVMEENVEVVRASTKKGDAKAKVSITVLDHGRPSQETHVRLLIDSGVNKTLISDKDWAKVRQRPGENPMKLKRVKTSFTPFGTNFKLPVIGRTKCVMRAAAGAEITTIVYVVVGEAEGLLGLLDAEKLGIIKINPEGERSEVIAQITGVKKLEKVNEGVVSGGQSAAEIKDKMSSLVGRYPAVFEGLGLAKVDPIHIAVDPKVKPVQQKPRPIALRYVDKFNAHIKELEAEGVVSGPLGSEHARGWVSNPVIVSKKWDPNKIRVNLDTRNMAAAVQKTHFPIPTSSQLRHSFRGSDRFSVLDMNHAFHQFPMDEDSKKLFVFYTPKGLYRFNTLVMGTGPASSECHENIRKILDGLEGVQQIKDDLVVHGKGQQHDLRLEAVLKRLQEFNLTLRFEKCQFGVPEVTWFGNVFSKQGMSPDPEKTRDIKEWKAPEDKSEVKSFLQTVQFCQPFMRPGGGRTYAKVTAPLRQLTAKNVKFVWSAKCQESFDELKQMLCSSTVLANYDPDLPTRVYVDHDYKGVAATVAQDHSKAGEDKVWQPVHYQSRSLTKSEQNYGKLDGESFSIIGDYEQQNISVWQKF